MTDIFYLGTNNKFNLFVYDKYVRNYAWFLYFNNKLPFTNYSI